MSMIEQPVATRVSPLRRLLPFWLFVLFFKLAAGLHYTLLAPLGERVLPMWIVGLLIGGASMLQLVLDVPAGALMDRGGYVRYLRVTCLFFLFAAAVLLFGPGPWAFIATVMLGSIGWLFFGPGVSAYVLVESTKAEAGRYIALRDVFNSLGVVGAMVILGWAVVQPWYVTGTVLLIFFVLAMVFIFITPRDRLSVHQQPAKIATQHHYIRRQHFHHAIRALKQLNPASSLLMMQGFSAGVFYAVVWFVVPLIVAQGLRGGEVLAAGMGVFDLAIVVLGVLIGRLADHWHKQRLVFFGLLIFSIAAAVIGFHFTYWFLLLGFLATAGDELSSVALWAWLDNLDEDHTEDALISGTVSMASDFGYAVGPVLAGVLYGVIGASWTIALGAIFILATWVTSVLVLKKHHVHSIPAARHPKPHRSRHKT